MIAKLAIAAALAGSATGAAAVLAQEPAPAPAVPPVATPSAAVPTPPPIPAANVRAVRDVPDPGGGAPWALRAFDTADTTCYELGRRDGDRFGWIDGSGTFTEARAGRGGTPVLCHDPRMTAKIGVSPMRFTTVETPAGAAPRPRETVTWGIADDGVQTFTPAGEAPITLGEDRLFLRVTPGEAGRGRLTGTVEYADGRRLEFNPIDAPPQMRQPKAGTEYVAASAPDPAGGEPWGVIAAQGEDGGLCLGTPDRLVGTQTGRIDRRLDIFSTVFDLLRCGDERPPTRAYPMRIDTLISSIDDQDATGRIERRVQAGRIVFWGRVHRDVATVTIRTPRDVRTLVPTSRAHVILAVYDGRFPGGRVTATARFKDGRTATRSLYVE